ncbi:MAG TPA: SatD family protein [Dyadobacter sp.]|jgi:hypothetical protein|nr:SatD family protein [Dyadobacter sp.]
MQKQDSFILMADIVASRSKDQKQLMRYLKEATKTINTRYAHLLNSPLTITLGDEFQGIVTSASAALQIIIGLDEDIFLKNRGFQLRYVLFEGPIDTPINDKIAHGMLGEGLTNARKALQEAKLTRNRYHIYLRNQELSNAVNSSFVVYQGILDAWNIPRDHELIAEFLEAEDYKIVAEKLGKTRSQIWKREKSLKINQYIAIKDILNYITR